MYTTEKLIAEFHLQDEVTNFVKEKVQIILGEKSHECYFAGHPHTCENKEPHIPHVTGHYHTVRAGTLQYYCGGIPGPTEAGRLVIIVKRKSSPSPEDAGTWWGYWFIAEK